MHAAAAGKSTLGIPKSVGQEFAESDPGGKLPERKQTGGRTTPADPWYTPPGEPWKPNYYAGVPSDWEINRGLHGGVGDYGWGWAMRGGQVPTDARGPGGYGYGLGQVDPATRQALPPPLRKAPLGSMNVDRPTPYPLDTAPEEVARQTYETPLPPLNLGRIERSSETPRQTMAWIPGANVPPEGQARGGQIHYQKPSASFRREHPTTSQGPQSAQQRRMVWATVHGADTGMPAAVAERFARSDAPGKLPKYVGKRQEGGGVGLGTEPGSGVGLGVRPRLQMGGMSTAMDMPFWTRAEARSIEDQPHGGGLIASSGAGRTDQLPLAVPVESHVIPAQEIAGLGQGNSMSGSRIMSAALSIGPWGIQPLRGVRGHGVPMPAPPRPYIDRTRFDAGGDLDEGGARHETSILAAGGEWIVPREDFLMRDEHGQLILHAGVRTVGEGDIAKGHERLNAMIKNIRNHTIKFLRSAPPPKS